MCNKNHEKALIRESCSVGRYKALEMCNNTTTATTIRQSCSVAGTKRDERCNKKYEIASAR